MFFERAEGKGPQNEYGFDSNDLADSWEDLWRGAIYFQGDGVMRVGMSNGKREENAISMRKRMVMAGPHVKLSRTNYPPQIYSKYSDYVELTGKKHNSITLFSEKRGGEDMPFWSYYTDRSDATYVYKTLELKDIVKSDLELKLTAEPGSYTVDPMVSAGCAIPEMVVQSGATLKLTMQRGENYTFTKPIRQEGGNLEIDGTTANITGLDVRGTGTVIFNGGTVSGTVEKAIKMVVKDGNIDVPDYGNTVDGNGNAVHKFVYTVETEERYTQPLQIKTMTGPDEYDTVSLSSGPFHQGENNERLLYRCVIKNTPNDRDYNGIRYSAAVTLTVTRNCALEGHELDEGTVTTAPTCTATGLKTFTCSACGGTEVTILPALDHDWAAATCMTPKTCRRDGCGAKEGTVDQNNHTGEKVWSTTERRHTQRYNCCGLVTVETEEHTWEKGVCTLCAYRCVSHTGGTATCVKKAECEICGEEYGDYGSHDYAADWTSDEQEHWHGCALCDSRSDAGMHADGDKDHLCDTCGRTISGHTGGTATCVKKAVCEDCGEAYGEVDGGNHEALVRVPAKAAAEDAEGNSEYWYCSACGKYYGDEKGTKEITEADTVIVKLPQTPQTGDSGLTLWLTLLLGAAMAAAVMGKKKKREA